MLGFARLFTSDGYLGPPVDLWSFGVMLHLAVTTKLPFEANTIDTLIELVTKKQFELPADSACSPQLRTLLMYAAFRPHIYIYISRLANPHFLFCFIPIVLVASALFALCAIEKMSLG